MKRLLRSVGLSSAALLLAAVSAAEVSPESVAGRYEGESGTLEVKAAGGTSIEVNMELSNPIGHSGGASVSGALTNGAGQFTLADFPKCSFKMKFSGNKLSVTQNGADMDCGFGADVTADGEYKKVKVIPAAPSVPGAPGESACKHPAHSNDAPPGTTIAINEAQQQKAQREACKMRAAYLRVAKAAQAKSGAADRLAAAQTAWVKFLAAHEGERYPHEDEQGYYGSIIGLCVGIHDEQMYRARAKDLDALHSCSKPASATAKAEEDAKAAAAKLADAARRVNAANGRDPKAAAAFQAAQRAFEQWNIAQATFVAAASGGNAACYAGELARGARARAAELEAWLKPKREGDSCSQ